MIDFTLRIPTKIYFGKDSLSHLTKETRRLGRRVLLVYGGGSVKRTGLYQQAVALLQAENAEISELSGVQPNPRLGLVREGIALCREKNAEWVLALGGGSAIDTAKAIANGVFYDGDPWDLFEGKGRNERALPLGAVPTLPAAGSEMSDSCVITRESDQCKRGRNTPLNYPSFAILNPEYTYTLPPFQTACGAADILAHMMERYFTNTEHVELIDRMTEGAMKTVLHQTPVALKTPDDYNARSELTWAAALAHNGLLGTGRETDWASHKLEHELSALYDVAHGAGLAIVFPAWMKYAVSRGRARKLAQFACRVFDVPETFGSEEEIAAEGVARLESFYRSIGLHTTLGEIGIGEENFQRMARRAVALGGGQVGRYLPLREEDVLAIYRLAL